MIRKEVSHRHAGVVDSYPLSGHDKGFMQPHKGKIPFVLVLVSRIGSNMLGQ
jgi:hypothetical protein